MRLRFSAELSRSDIAIGVVVVDGVHAVSVGKALQQSVMECVTERQGELSSALEARRVACRDMLRNGSYKPTGRGKPANEYLLRAAHQGSFPTINALVDANNLVSLKHMVPISVWDLDRSNKGHFLFRLGAEGEQYIFNQGGQELVLKDLLCGCEVNEDGSSVPIVNAIKDCLRTKTTAETRRVAAAIYCPLGVLTPQQVSAICAELLLWLEASGPGARGAHGIVQSGNPLVVELQ